MTELMENVIAVVSASAKPFNKDNIKDIVEKNNDPVNVVTNVDKEVEYRLKENLIPLIYGSKFIGEESGADDYNADTMWVVDPIDGTSNFVRGIPLAFVSVGLMQGKEPVLGVTYNPLTGDMWYAEKGHGAYLNGDKITVSDKPMKNGVFSMHFGDYNKDKAHVPFAVTQKLFKDVETVRNFGSIAYSLAAMSSGQVELMYSMYCYAWDVASGLCLLKEAGGHYTLFSGNGDEWYRGPLGIIAANSEETLRALRDVHYNVLGAI